MCCTPSIDGRMFFLAVDALHVIISCLSWAITCVMVTNAFHTSRIVMTIVCCMTISLTVFAFRDVFLCGVLQSSSLCS